MIHNPNFNCTEFGTFRNMAGRYGGTYAHRDIAYHFGMWKSEMLRRPHALMTAAFFM
jgi:hypothetical protein